MILAAAAMLRNPAALRDFARRQVARLDPRAAARRKERALRKASVHVWQEESGNMGLSAREMPTGDGQIAWQNIERRALDLHAAGMPGTAGQLQVQAMLDYLLGRAVSDQQEGARQNAHTDHEEEADECARVDAHDEDEDGEKTRAWLDARASARRTGRGGGRGGWAVNPVLIVPWDPSLGRLSGPAELPGYGLIDQDDTMELLDAAGQDPASRWCLTVRGTDGTAAAHACIAGPRTLDAITQASLATALGTKLEPIAKGACDHAHAEPGYRPSRKLRHLIGARNARCTAYGCGPPASACDYDHTRPWDDGGRTNPATAPPEGLVSGTQLLVLVRWRRRIRTVGFPGRRQGGKVGLSDGFSLLNKKTMSGQ